MSDPALNVFSGPNSLRDFHDPDKNTCLPLVELPSHPFSSAGVKIFAKMLTMLPSANVKALPALNMILRGQESGTFDPSHDKIVEYSSGNTVISLAILNGLYGAQQGATAYISNKTSQQKLQLLRFFGLELVLFGGPAQVEPSDPYGGIHAAIQDGRKPNIWNPGQYSNPANSEAHIRWTGPQLAKQLPNISVFSASIGTSGTMTGTGGYLKSVRPDIVNLGVFTAPGDRVPGPRPIDLIQSVDLPWREVIDSDEHVTSVDAYTESLSLCRMGLLCGPSSGLALKGLYQYLSKVEQEKGGLDRLRGPDGIVTCAFICCDLPFQYIPEYFEKLDPTSFPKINREELLEVDLHPYGIDWKLSAHDSFEMIKGSPDVESHQIIALDLRDERDFLHSRIAGSVNLDIQASKDPNPFLDTSALARQWTTLSKLLTRDSARYGFLHLYKKLVVISYDGHTASVACSILRHHGAISYFVDGGFEAWKSAGLPTDDNRYHNLAAPTAKL